MDDDEQQVLAMLDDLAAEDAIPESIKMMNEAALRQILSPSFSRSILADAVFSWPSSSTS